ncbi:MAG: FAD-dependent thymidylate synthase [Clostridiales bacterium]|nr:FAD-dependent thymidylate synthase [Clostridiales bacterium]
MGKVEQKVVLVAHTMEPQQSVALGAKLCYSGADVEELKKGVEAKDQAKYIQRLVDVGHFSPIEHASFTFAIEGVSRSLLAQITRHRIASFSVQSQRYVDMAHEEGCFDYILPPAIEALGEDAAEEFHSQMMQIQRWYNDWQARLGKKGESSNEDARFVLPNAAGTKMLVTMNARELHHFFTLRCCNRAQWEIRALAWEMLRQVRQVAPALFNTAGPGCLSGPCPEGRMCCGKQAEVKKRFEELI